MATPKPIKRSEQLAPLSRDHHDALLFVWKIRQGLKNRTPEQEMIAYVHWYWNNHLQLHFSQEEHLLLPHLPESDDIAIRLKDEHRTIKEIISSQLTVSSLAVLADKMNDHIRFEERKLFPHIEKTLATGQLNSIYRQLEHQPHCHDKWENEFWQKKT
ncbi:MAG: hemerythrin domain-containing protein [Chitinophagaceae bacterium]|nr:hemerythrin domain-containing protein [Chitinophagaceae bacterium]